MADKTVNPNFRMRHQRNNLLIFIALLLHFTLADKIWGTTCLIQGTIGFPCPTCGSTRAAAYLFKGDLKAAFYWHPLIILSLIILIAGIFIMIRNDLKKQRAFRRHESYHVNYLGHKFWYIYIPILVIYLIVFIIRFISLYPQPPFNYNHSSMLGRLLALLKRIIH